MCRISIKLCFVSYLSCYILIFVFFFLYLFRHVFILLFIYHVVFVFILSAVVFYCVYFYFILFWPKAQTQAQGPTTQPKLRFMLQTRPNTILCLMVKPSRVKGPTLCFFLLARITFVQAISFSTPVDSSACRPWTHAQSAGRGLPQILQPLMQTLNPAGASMLDTMLSSLHGSSCHPAWKSPSSPTIDSRYRAPRARHETANPCLLQLPEITPMCDKLIQPCKLLLQQTYEDAQRLPCSLSPHTFVIYAPPFSMYPGDSLFAQRTSQARPHAHVFS